MSFRENIAFRGIIGAAVAITLIAATAYVLPNFALPSNTTITVVPTLSNETNESKTTTLSSSSPTGPTGTLSALLTDPPIVPANTTNVFMSYDNLSVHYSGDGNSSQYWQVIAREGTIDLMQLINVSQTIGIGSATVGSSFNAIGFNISSVVVTYNGRNYTATLISAPQNLYVPIPGGVSINASQTGAVLVDMTPKLVLLSTPQFPSFGFLPSSSALVVPSNSVPVSAHVLGGRHNLQQDAWWTKEINMTRFVMASVVLTPTSLQINVTNDGSVPVTFRLATVTPESPDNTNVGSLPPLQGSAVFSVFPNSSLYLLAGTNRETILDQLGSSGYVLSPHATVTLSYTGIIELGLIQFVPPSPQAIQLLSTGSYIVRLFGNGYFAFQQLTVEGRN